MKVRVTQQHIDAGEPEHAEYCPVARAVAEACPLIESVLVLHKKWWGDNVSHPLPRSAQRFIARYDAGKPVKPFAFIL